MACAVELFVTTTSPIQVTLTDDAGAPVTGATVQITQILDVLANTAVSGFTPPLSMPETPASSGIYLGFLAHTVAFAALRKYKLKITATLLGGQVATYFKETFAKEG